MSAGRVKIGIEGLDDMLGGGLIPLNICAIIGTYGTGKTTFALHFVWEGLQRKENILYISLEERGDRILTYMKQKKMYDVDRFNYKSLDPSLKSTKTSQPAQGADTGHDQTITPGAHLNPPAQDAKTSSPQKPTLVILKLDPTDFSLANNQIKREIPKLIREVNASRVVIDPISLFEDLFDNDSERRQEMFRYVEGLREQKCTIMLTSETHQNYPYSSRHGLIEYLSDTVILLRYIRPSDLTDVHLALEVVKMRESAHSREIKPYEIKQDQVVVYSEANVF